MTKCQPNSFLCDKTRNKKEIILFVAIEILSFGLKERQNLRMKASKLERYFANKVLSFSFGVLSHKKMFGGGFLAMTEFLSVLSLLNYFLSLSCSFCGAGLILSHLFLFIRRLNRVFLLRRLLLSALQIVTQSVPTGIGGRWRSN